MNLGGSIINNAKNAYDSNRYFICTSQFMKFLTEVNKNFQIN